jgi:hypothetical protein
MKLSRKNALLMVFLAVLAVLFFYVFLPAPDFPAPPPDSVQSMEKADTEDVSVKRAYFTDFTREEVLIYYQAQFAKSPLLQLPLITYRLNYPPEDAQTLIRDQTRSTFLEELVHPLRESFFVNGFEPKAAKDDIWYKGIHYRQKITVKYYKSGTFVRVLVVILSLTIIILLSGEIVDGLKKLSGVIRRKNV